MNILIYRWNSYNYIDIIATLRAMGHTVDVIEQELVEKCGYYLAHEDERLEIAGNGYEKVKVQHSIRNRLETITIQGVKGMGTIYTLAGCGKSLYNGDILRC